MEIFEGFAQDPTRGSAPGPRQGGCKPHCNPLRETLPSRYPLTPPRTKILEPLVLLVPFLSSFGELMGIFPIIMKPYKKFLVSSWLSNHIWRYHLRFAMKSGNLVGNQLCSLFSVSNSTGSDLSASIVFILWNQ